jgi:immune inhibitor A
MVRRLILGLTTTALLTLLLSGAAQAAPSGTQYAPPNEAAFAKALKKAGLIPRGASRAEIVDIIQTVMRRHGKPEDRVINFSRTRVAPKLRDMTVWGRVNRSRLRAGVEQVKDKALVLLVDFSENPADAFKGKLGPLRGEIPAPGKYDNATYWPGDFSVKHYQNMLFGSSYKLYDAKGTLRGSTKSTMRNYFLEQSRQQYLINGTVVAWVTVPHPEVYYGEDVIPYEAGIDEANGPPWRLVRDAVAAYAAANPSFNWAAYDRANPYGIAGDDPNVPDGYIDHLVVIHAGVDESSGGGAQGSDALWAHSSWIDELNGKGPYGAGLGGYQVPGTTGLGVWAGPYTMDPEDGAAGVFCHEFAHDLGLPDQYDTMYYGESPTGFWTLMDNGSWGGRKYGAGYRPGGLTAWEKVALGWLEPIVVANGKVKTLTLQGAALGSGTKAAVKILAPDSVHTVVLDGGSTPAWWSGMGNDLENMLTMNDPVSVPAAPGALSMRTWYEIEGSYDWGIVEASADNGASWKSLRGSATEEVTSGGGVHGLTGTSGGAGGPAWVDVTYDLTPFAGQTVKLRFRYLTDPGVSPRGWQIAWFSFAGQTWDTSVPARFTTDSWSIVTGKHTAISTQYYLAEYRNWKGFDDVLKNVYQFKNADTTQVDWYPYSQGLLLMKRDTFYQDNMTAMHPGDGMLLPLDAHPYPDFFQVGLAPVRAVASVNANWRSRVQTRDAAFSRMRTPEVTLSSYGWMVGAQTLPSRPKSPVFDDSWVYFSEAAPDAGVNVPTYGLHIEVLEHSPTAMKIKIDNPLLPVE